MQILHYLYTKNISNTFIILLFLAVSDNFCRKVITMLPETPERGAAFHWPRVEHGFFAIEGFYLFSVNDTSLKQQGGNESYILSQ